MYLQNFKYIQCEKAVYFSFDFGCSFSINFVFVRYYELGGGGEWGAQQVKSVKQPCDESLLSMSPNTGEEIEGKLVCKYLTILLL